MGYRKIKLDCASVCSDARSRGQPRHRANLMIMLILRDKNSVLILCIIVVAVFFGQGSMWNNIEREKGMKISVTKWQTDTPKPGSLTDHKKEE